MRVGRALVGIAALATGCAPDLGDPVSLVTGPRILAIRGDPPEARPGAAVALEALVVTPEGEALGASAAWALCASPKPLTEDDTVSGACLDAGVRAIPGAALAVMTAIPKDACALFGPDTPPGGFRPRDPDATGGFYQPARLRALGLTAFARERVTCSLANAPVDAAIDLAKRYHPNQNPALGPLTAAIGGAPASLDRLPAGGRVRFAVGWSAADAETYAMFDPASRAVVDRREALRVAWFVTAGALDADVTGRGEDELEVTTDNSWTAPAGGSARLWLVLRDSRGGVSFAGYTLTIVP